MKKDHRVQTAEGGGFPDRQSGAEEAHAGVKDKQRQPLIGVVILLLSRNDAELTAAEKAVDRVLVGGVHCRAAGSIIQFGNASHGVLVAVGSVLPETLLLNQRVGVFYPAPAAVKAERNDECGGVCHCGSSSCMY